MADAIEQSEWNRTSHILAWLQNWSGFAESNVSPKELNPYASAEDEADDRDTIDASDLALMLCGQSAIDHFAEADRRQGRTS